MTTIDADCKLTLYVHPALVDGKIAVKFEGIPRTYTPQDLHRALKRIGAFKRGDVSVSNGKSNGSM